MDVVSLLHWEFSSPSVFLFVWNTATQKGFWKPIPETIRNLDENNGGWRKSKRVRLHFQAAYNCDTPGLELLRLHLLNHNPHIVDKAVGKTQTLFFPNTPAGNEAMAKFRRHLDYGGDVTIDGSFLETSEPLRRLQGPIANWETTVSAHPVPSPHAIGMRLEMKSADGSISMLPIAQMHLLESTNKRTIYVNGHPVTPFSPEIIASPLNLRWTHLKDEKQEEWSISTANSRPTARQAAEVLPFLKAFMQGGEFRAIPLSRPHPKEHWVHNTGQPLPRLHPASAGGALDPEFEGWLEALLIIEKQFNLHFLLQNWNITRRDFWAIAEVISAIASGRSHQKFARFPVGIAPLSTEPAHQEAKAIVERHRRELASGGAQWRFSEVEDHPLNILGQSVDVGVRTAQVTGQIAVTPQELERVFAHALAGKDALFFLRDVHVITTYDNFPSGNIDNTAI